MKDCENIRALSNKRLANEENQTYKLTKILRSEMKEETWEKTLS